MTPVATQPPERTPVSALQSTSMEAPASTEEPSSAPPSTLPGVILGSSTPRDLEEMIQIYARNVQEHGFSARTLLYYSSKPHEAKVKQYCDILLELIQNKQIIADDSLL